MHESMRFVHLIFHGLAAVKYQPHAPDIAPNSSTVNVHFVIPVADGQFWIVESTSLRPQGIVLLMSRILHRRH